MNGAVFDTTGNVFFKLKYSRLYDSVLATPLGAAGTSPSARSPGRCCGARSTPRCSCSSWRLAHAVTTWWAVLTLPAAVFVGLAFAGAGMAATTYMRSWKDLDLVQLAVLPMFLFSATFYPLSTYPRSLQWVVQVTPLYQAVALTRELALGGSGWATLAHAGYLVVLGLVGTVVAARRLERTLLS